MPPISAKQKEHPYRVLFHYHAAPTGDLGALFGGSAMIEDYIRTEIALCDFIQTKQHTPKQMMISFDEYASKTQVRCGSL